MWGRRSLIFTIPIFRLMRRIASFICDVSTNPIRGRAFQLWTCFFYDQCYCLLRSCYNSVIVNSVCKFRLLILKRNLVPVWKVHLLPCLSSGLKLGCLFFRLCLLYFGISTSALHLSYTDDSYLSCANILPMSKLNSSALIRHLQFADNNCSVVRTHMYNPEP